jgi:hypothetical protein
MVFGNGDAIDMNALRRRVTEPRHTPAIVRVALAEGQEEVIVRLDEGASGSIMRSNRSTVSMDVSRALALFRRSATLTKLLWCWSLASFVAFDPTTGKGRRVEQTHCAAWP